MTTDPDTIPILQRLESARIFSIEKKGNGFLITEECDRFFHELLTEDELRQLSFELLALADAQQRPAPTTSNTTQHTFGSAKS